MNQILSDFGLAKGKECWQHDKRFVNGYFLCSSKESNQRNDAEIETPAFIVVLGRVHPQSAVDFGSPTHGHRWGKGLTLQQEFRKMSARFL